MNEAEVKSRLESWRWSLEEEKTFTELIAWAAMEKASVPILRSCRNLDKYIAYLQLKKAACRQSREEHKRLLDLVTDDAARQVLYMRYEQGCTAQYFMDTDENNNTFLLEEDFEELIERIKSIHISNKYVGLMSWLVDRAFKITPQMQSNKESCNSNMWRNRPILLKVLYTINPEALLKCFSKGII